MFSSALTVYLEHVLGTMMMSNLIDSNTLICPIMVCGHWSEVQHVLLSVVRHVLVQGVHVEFHVVLHPVGHVVGPNNVTRESEVFLVYWGCFVVDHHGLYCLCEHVTQ